jgi:hypothetical protein
MAADTMIATETATADPMEPGKTLTWTVKGKEKDTSTTAAKGATILAALIAKIDKTDARLTLPLNGGCVVGALSGCYQRLRTSDKSLFLYSADGKTRYTDYNSIPTTRTQFERAFKTEIVNKEAVVRFKLSSDLTVPEVKNSCEGFIEWAKGQKIWFEEDRFRTARQRDLGFFPGKHPHLCRRDEFKTHVEDVLSKMEQTYEEKVQRNSASISLRFDTEGTIPFFIITTRRINAPDISTEGLVIRCEEAHATYLNSLLRRACDEGLLNNNQDFTPYYLNSFNSNPADRVMFKRMVEIHANYLETVSTVAVNGLSEKLLNFEVQDNAGLKGTMKQYILTNTLCTTIEPTLDTENGLYYLLTTREQRPRLVQWMYTAFTEMWKSIEHNFPETAMPTIAASKRNTTAEPDSLTARLSARYAAVVVPERLEKRNVYARSRTKNRLPRTVFFSTDNKMEDFPNLPTRSTWGKKQTNSQRSSQASTQASTTSETAITSLTKDEVQSIISSQMTEYTKQQDAKFDKIMLMMQAMNSTSNNTAPAAGAEEPISEIKLLIQLMQKRQDKQDEELEKERKFQRDQLAMVVAQRESSRMHPRQH